jgi:hypothetical protein
MGVGAATAWPLPARAQQGERVQAKRSPRTPHPAGGRGKMKTVLLIRVEATPLRKAHCRPGKTWQDFFEQLWRYRNTLTILKKRHTAGPIAWSDSHQPMGGLS